MSKWGQLVVKTLSWRKGPEQQPSLSSLHLVIRLPCSDSVVCLVKPRNQSLSRNMGCLWVSGFKCFCLWPGIVAKCQAKSERTGSRARLKRAIVFSCSAVIRNRCPPPSLLRRGDCFTRLNFIEHNFNGRPITPLNNVSGRLVCVCFPRENGAHTSRAEQAGPESAFKDPTSKEHDSHVSMKLKICSPDFD